MVRFFFVTQNPETGEPKSVSRANGPAGRTSSWNDSDSLRENWQLKIYRKSKCLNWQFGDGWREIVICKVTVEKAFADPGGNSVEKRVFVRNDARRIDINDAHASSIQYVQNRNKENKIEARNVLGKNKKS